MYLFDLLFKYIVYGSLLRKSMGHLTEKISSSVVLVFHALILGMAYTKEKGYKHVNAIGNSVDLHNMYGKPWKLTDKDKDIRYFYIKTMDI